MIIIIPFLIIKKQINISMKKKTNIFIKEIKNEKKIGEDNLILILYLLYIIIIIIIIISK
jgi:Trk-type K+ transport system membrane component